MQPLWAKARKRKSSRRPLRRLRLRAKLRVLRLAIRLRRGKLLSFASNLLFLKRSREWTFPQLERRSAILSSQRSE